MLSVQTNGLSSLCTRQLNHSTNNLKTSLERLSTGFKINKAADNASNLSISKKMSCQVSGTDMALENTQQGVNLLDTADGALGVMADDLNRMRDLCVQAMNGTYSDEERRMMQEEVDKLTAQIYQTKDTTYYNKIQLFADDSQNSSVDGITDISGGGQLVALMR